VRGWVRWRHLGTFSAWHHELDGLTRCGRLIHEHDALERREPEPQRVDQCRRCRRAHGQEVARTALAASRSSS